MDLEGIVALEYSIKSREDAKQLIIMKYNILNKLKYILNLLGCLPGSRTMTTWNPDNGVLHARPSCATCLSNYIGYLRVMLEGV